MEKSLYTLGNINAKQENSDEAVDTFQKLINEFPHSDFIAEAERRIAEIRPSIDGENSDEDTDEDTYVHQDQVIYQTAANLQRQGRVHDAYQLYTDITTQFPESEYVTDAYVAKAEIHLAAEDYVNARENYEAAMYSTDNEEQRIGIYKKYQLTYLVPIYADKVRPHSSSDELFVKARLFRRAEQFSEAAEIYEQLANSNLSAEDEIYALYWAGRCYHEAAFTNSSLFNKSVSAFKKLIGNYSSGEYTIEAYYYLSSVYVDWAKIPGNTSKCQLAINTVEEANEKYTDSDDVRNRGWLNRMQEIKKIARPKLGPPPPPPPPPPPVPDHGSLVDQGYKHLGRGELEKALEKVRQALDIDTDYQRAYQLLSAIKDTYYGRGWTFFDEKQYEKAIAAFKNAIDLDPNFKEAHCHLGVIYIEQQSYTKALEVLKKAVEIDPRFKEAHFNLALAYVKRGEFEFARNAATAALEIDPNYESARMLIEFIAD